MNGLILFIIIFFTIILTVGAVITIYILGKKSVYNNPNKAIVIIKNGNEGKQYKGLLIQTSKNSRRYKYSNNKTILLPNKYETIFVKNKILIFANKVGQLISSPFSIHEKLSLSERETLIYEALESKVGSDAVKSLQGSNKTNVFIFAIIAFIIGVVCVIGYNYISKAIKQQQTTQPITQQVQPAQENNTGVRIEKNE